MSELKELVQRLAGTHGESKVRFILCTVTAVNEGARTCIADSIDVTSGTEDITVNLMTEIGDSVFVVPSIGSTIEVCMSDIVLPFMIGFPSSIDKIFIVTGDKVFNMTAAGFSLSQMANGSIIESLTKILTDFATAFLQLQTQSPGGDGALSPTSIQQIQGIINRIPNILI